MADTKRIWPWTPKPAPEPAPEPTPKPAPAPSPKYLKALWALKDIPLSKLFPLVFTVPVVVFLALSGLVAWLVVFASFVTHLFWVLT
jgi:hypothetical protein